MTGDWRDYAACRDPGLPEELHFPVGTTGPAVAQANAAKAVCARCPVRAECLEWALRRRSTPITAGIWGGIWFDDGEARAYRRGERQVTA